MNRQQAFLLVLVALSAVVSLLIVVPFLEYVLAALIFGYVLWPVHRHVRPYLGDRVGAIAVIVAAIVAIVLPLAYVGLVLYRDLQALAAGETGLDVAEIEGRVHELTGEQVDLEAVTGEAGQLLIDVLFGSVTEAVSVFFTLSLGFALVLFLVYYVLVDGPSFVRWAVGVMPMNDAVAQRLLVQVDRTTWGVVVGHIFVAVVQGIVGGIGLFFADIPNYVFWTFVMIVLALLPLIGAFLVWGPAAGYLYLVSDVGAAVFLLAWGILVVSMIDNYARPIVIDRSAHLNPGVILVGVFGGVYALGFVGLFVGPIVLGVLAATLSAFQRDYDALSDETPPPDPPETTLTWFAPSDVGGADVPDDAGADDPGGVTASGATGDDSRDSSGEDGSLPGDSTASDGGTVAPEDPTRDGTAGSGRSTDGPE